MKRFIPLFLALFLGLSFAATASLAQDKLVIPDECIAKKDTFSITDQKDWDDYGPTPWSDEKSVWIQSVGNRKMLVMCYHTGKDSPPIYILGAFLKHKEVTKTHNTYLYVRIKDDCKLRDRILADLKKQHPKRDVYWD